MTPPNGTIKYSWVDGAEALERYRPGGYHPVEIGDRMGGLMHKRYRIVDKLGYGDYSTVWLARDTRSNRYVALKVGVSDSPSPQREPVILRELDRPRSPLQAAHPGRQFIPNVWDEFKVRGPNGTHVCSVTAPAQGDLKKASLVRLFPVEVARALAAALTYAVAYIHSQGFVHGDIRLQNVLVGLPSSFHSLSIQDFTDKYGDPQTRPVDRIDGRPLTKNAPPIAVLPLYMGTSADDFTLVDAANLILTDFGEAFELAKDKRLGKESDIPVASSPPEAWFEPDSPLSYPSDVWSLATAIWDILGTRFLFSESEPPDEVVAEHLDVLGTQGFPKSWWEDWTSTETVLEDDDRRPRQPTTDRSKRPPLDEAFEEYVQKHRRSRVDTVGVFGDDETKAILELMRGMLKFQAEDRWAITEVLTSEWMVKWALPALKKAMDETKYSNTHQVR